MSPPILLIVSVDTEEDNWQPCREGVTIENIRELPRLDVLFQQLGVRATYFATYQVAIREWAAATLRQLRTGGAEIGAHLHPWNTPPLDEPFLARNSMLKNLPPALQLAKLERLTATPLHSLHLLGIASRLGLITRILLSPETHSVADMLTLSRRLIEGGCRHLHLFFHSPSLRPGLSPFVTDAPGVERFYRTIASYVENLTRLASVTFATVSEAAAQLQAAGSADQVVAESVSASPT